MRGIALCLLVLLMSFASFALDEVKLCEEVLIDPGRAHTWSIYAFKVNGRKATEEESMNALIIPSGKSVLLEMNARLHYGRLAGSTTAMVIRINGMTMDAHQLVNKHISFQTRGGAVLTWYGNGSWRVLYSPDFKVASDDVANPYSVIDADPYKFTFDITDMLLDGKNTITIQHTVASISSRLVIRDARIRIADERISKPAGVEALPKYVPTTPKPYQYSVQWLEGGGMRITVSDENFILGTELSVPGGGWHELKEQMTPSPCGLRISIDRKTKRHLLLKASCSHYSFEREAECHDEWIDVNDTVVNLTQEDLGVCVRHIVRREEGKPTHVYLCGLEMKAPRCKNRSNGNMTTLLVGSKAMIGLLPLDDVFRVHCINFREGDHAGICDSELVLPSNGRISMRWRIHPLMRPEQFEDDSDYWAFINSVRRGLDVNFKLEGPFAFLSPSMLSWSDDMLMRWLELRNVKFVSGTIGRLPDGRYAHGTAYLTAKEDHMLWRELFRRIRSLRPDVKCLMYFHSFISTEEDAEKKYADARLTSATGKQLAYPHSTYLPLFYPTLTNSYGKALTRYFDVVFNEIGADGIYWDEIEFSASLWTYDCWDGYSADLHPDTFSVLRKKAAIPLLTQPWKIAQIERLLKAGKVIIGNGMPMTESMAKLRVIRFRETGSLFNLLDSHTYTPIGLGDHFTQRTEQDVVDQIRRNLSYGALYFYYPAAIQQTHTNLTEHMFPFTPIELHSGVLIGEERILTNRSGIFGWGDKARVKVYAYDESGKAVQLEPDIVSDDKQTLVKLRLPPRYVAAIVRE